MAIIPIHKQSALAVDELPLLDLMANMAAALGNSQELEAWCFQNYDRPLSVFAGSDPENPPLETSYPLVELFALEDSHGREVEQYERLLGLVCGIHDPEIDPIFYNDLQIQQGVFRLEGFYRLVLDALASADLLGGYIASVEGRRAEENLHPFFLLGAEIRIVKPI